MNITLNLNSAGNSLDLIKYCTLYFDKLEIDAPIVIDGVKQVGETDSKGRSGCIISWLPPLSEEVVVMKNILLEEGICIDNGKSSWGNYNDLSKKIVLKNAELLFEKDSFVHNRTGITIQNDARALAEAQEVLDAIITQEARERTKENNPDFEHWEAPDFYYIVSIYKGLVDLLLTHIEAGQNVVTNSDVVNQMLFRYYSRKKRQIDTSRLKYNYAQIEATKVLLPYVPNASLDDILDIRYKANDELLELRNYLSNTLNGLKADISEMTYEDIDCKIRQTIIPSVRAFERKLSGLNIDTAKTFMENMKNPAVYVPLTASFFTNYFPGVPNGPLYASSLMALLGNTILSRWGKKKELENDPLYFSVKLNNRFLR